MNATNARNIGFEDSKTFIAGYRTTVGNGPFFTGAHWTIVMNAARNRANHTYRVKSRTTANLYVAGAAAAWEACEREWQQEQEEAARRANVPHNPNTRFCTCVACREA